MSNYICPKCSKELEVIAELFLKCSSCGFNTTKEDYIKQNSHWLTNIANDNTLWHKDIFDANIPIISHEYKRLYNLCEEKQSYGMLLEIKDIFEVVLKFPTLIVASMLHKKRDGLGDDESKLLIAMLEKQLSLGTWETLANSAKKLNIDDNLKQWLENITTIFNKKAITNWRNEEIGHGALSLEENEKFKNDIEEKIKILKEFFETNITLMKKIKDDNYQQIIDKSIFFKKDGDGFLHFFDSFSMWNKKTSRVEYQNGVFKKEIEDKILQLSNGFNIQKDENMLDECAEDKARDALSQEIFEKLLNVDDFVEPTYITNWLDENLKTNKKGLFLLQMQRGMGKSMFSRALDELNLAKITLQDTTTRAYYINGIYGYKFDEFTSVIDREILNRQLVDKEIKDKLRGDIPKSLDINSTPKDLVRLLNEYKNIHKKEKILLVIDGLDEIPQNKEKDLLSIIPNSNELEDGIYILLTSRIEVSPYLQEFLGKKSYTDTKKVTLDDENYNSNTKKYIKDKISNKLTDDEIKTIYEKSQKRYVYLKLIRELIKSMGLNITEIPQADKMVQTYLDNLKNRYGDKFFKNITNLLAVISTQFEPMSLKEIAYMLQEDCISFKLLAHINDTRGFLEFKRSYRGNLISIAHEDIKIVLQTDQEIQKTKKEQTKSILNNLQNKEHKIDTKSDGETYFLSYFWDYSNDIVDKFDDDFLSEVFKCSLDMQKTTNKLFMDRSINIYTQFIKYYEHCELNGIHFDRNDLASAFINRGNAHNSLKESNKALEDCNKAIDIFEELDNNPNIQFNIYDFAGVFMNRGIAYESLREAHKAKKDYNKVIDIYEELNSNPNINFDKNKLAKVLNNRGIVYQNSGETDKALKNYNKAIDIYEELDSNPNIHFDKDDFAKVLNNRGIVYRSLGKAYEALKDYEKVIEIYEELDKDSSIYLYKNNLAAIFMNRGVIHQNLEKIDEALKDYEKAISIYEELDSNPNIHFDRDGFATSLNHRGIIYQNYLEKMDEALKDYEKAINIFEELDNNPNIQFNIYDFANSLNNRGNIYQGQDFQNFNQAIKDYSKAIKMYEKLDNNPNIHFNKDDLIDTLRHRGIAYYNLPDIKQAKRDFTKFFEIIVDLLYKYLQNNNTQMAQTLLQRYQFSINQMIEGDFITNTEYIQRYKELLENKK